MTETVDVSFRGKFAMEEPWPVREGHVIAEKYVVGRLLGKGGMGVVFEARDRALERRVAIKILRPQLMNAPTASERFIREARSATRIMSEHCVKILEIGTLPAGLPFLVMEFLEGRDLGTLLSEEGPMRPEQAADFILQALQALAEAHLKNIVHRDIKPSNIFLTHRPDGSALVKVLDFGIAKTLEPDGQSADITSSEDSRLGSPAYMSPEQLRDARSVDHRSDLWAVGVTLYELMSGETPFHATDAMGVVSNILSPAPLRLRNQPGSRELPIELERVVLSCLERDPDRRVANACELAAKLAPFGSEDGRLSLSRIQRLPGPWVRAGRDVQERVETGRVPVRTRRAVVAIAVALAVVSSVAFLRGRVDRTSPAGDVEPSHPAELGSQTAGSEARVSVGAARAESTEPSTTPSATPSAPFEPKPARLAQGAKSDRASRPASAHGASPRGQSSSVGDTEIEALIETRK